jgi:glutamate carboxypeptidase
VNALYELSHQLLQLSDLSRRDQGLSLNWTVSQAGTNRNVIPAQATAQGDARALKVSDFAELEATLQQRVKTQRIPDGQGAAPLRDAPPAAGSHARLAPPGRPRPPPSTGNWDCH